MKFCSFFLFAQFSWLGTCHIAISTCLMACKVLQTCCYSDALFLWREHAFTVSCDDGNEWECSLCISPVGCVDTAKVQVWGLESANQSICHEDQPSKNSPPYRLPASCRCFVSVVFHRAQDLIWGSHILMLPHTSQPPPISHNPDSRKTPIVWKITPAWAAADKVVFVLFAAGFCENSKAIPLAFAAASPMPSINRFWYWTFPFSG
jgi:hypothetical protein